MAVDEFLITTHRYYLPGSAPPPVRGSAHPLGRSSAGPLIRTAARPPGRSSADRILRGKWKKGSEWAVRQVFYPVMPNYPAADPRTTNLVWSPDA